MTMPSTTIEEAPTLRRCGENECDGASKITADEPSQSQQQSPEQQQAEDEDDATSRSMALNDAFLALEDMRKANLDVEFGGSVNHGCCTQCLREAASVEKGGGDAAAARRKSWHRRGGLRGRKASPPCFICASPVCARHGSRDFRRDRSITVCGQCAPLFTMDFIVDTISDDSEGHRRECIDRMIDSYDRALLMLRYSSQYIDDIAEALENGTRRHNRVGLGSSATGLMSGFTGVAAAAAHFAVGAATILTPAGPPLLIASILFGGTAAAASTGAEAINYYSEPNQLANKILALHELLHSLLCVTTVLKDALLNGRIDVEHYMDERGATKFIRAPRENEKVRDESSNEDAEDKATAAAEEASLTSRRNSDEGIVKVDAEEEDGSEAETETSASTSGSESDTDAEEPGEASVDSADDPGTTTTTTNTEIADEGPVTETKVIVAPASSYTRLAVSRATTNAMKAAQVATIACGVLSAATIVMEAKQMTDTIERMRAGNPCEKARVLKSIKEEVGRLPETRVIAEECESFLKATAGQKNLY